jgi:hypothetical protein
MTRAAMWTALIVCIAKESAEDAVAALGKTSRIPTLWIYAQNDKFFGPEPVHRMQTAPCRRNACAIAAARAICGG